MNKFKNTKLTVFWPNRTQGVLNLNSRFIKSEHLCAKLKTFVAILSTAYVYRAPVYGSQVCVYGPCLHIMRCKMCLPAKFSIAVLIKRISHNYVDGLDDDKKRVQSIPERLFPVLEITLKFSKFRVLTPHTPSRLIPYSLVVLHSLTNLRRLCYERTCRFRDWDVSNCIHFQFSNNYSLLHFCHDIILFAIVVGLPGGTSNA